MVFDFFVLFEQLTQSLLFKEKMKKIIDKIGLSVT